MHSWHPSRRGSRPSMHGPLPGEEPPPSIHGLKVVDSCLAKQQGDNIPGPCAAAQHPCDCHAPHGWRAAGLAGSAVAERWTAVRPSSLHCALCGKADGAVPCMPPSQKVEGDGAGGRSRGRTEPNQNQLIYWTFGSCCCKLQGGELQASWQGVTSPGRLLSCSLTKLVPLPEPAAYADLSPTIPSCRSIDLGLHLPGGAALMGLRQTLCSFLLLAAAAGEAGMGCRGASRHVQRRGAGVGGCRARLLPGQSAMKHEPLSACLQAHRTSQPRR